MGFMGDMNLHFLSAEHEVFYRKVIAELASDGRGELVAYILGSSPITREHYMDIYDGTLRSGCWNEPWNTPESRLLIAWAAAMTGDIETPAAASGTLVPCLLAAYRWSDALEGET